MNGREASTVAEGSSIAFGVSTVARDIDTYVEWARLADSSGFGLIGFGDSQLRWADPYAMLAVTARETRRARIGTFVTSPVTREPSVTASFLQTLQSLSGGRAFLGIGTGGTATEDVGASSTLSDLAAYVDAVRALTSGGSVVRAGRTLRMLWQGFPTRAPIWVAGNGPRSLRLAGRIADGVIVGNGATPGLVAFALDQIGRGAAESGRTLADLDVWFMTRVLVAPSEAEGFDAIRFYLATYANNRIAAAARYAGVPVPADIERGLRGLQAEFRDDESLLPDKSHNADLIDKHGLRDWAGRLFAIAGTRDECVEKLKAVATAGATQIVVPQMSSDPVAETATLARESYPLSYEEVHNDRRRLGGSRREGRARRRRRPWARIGHRQPARQRRRLCHRVGTQPNQPRIHHAAAAGGPTPGRVG